MIPVVATFNAAAKGQPFQASAGSRESKDGDLRDGDSRSGSYAMGSRAVVLAHQALSGDCTLASTSELNAEFPVFTRWLFCGLPRKAEFQIEGTHAFVLNKQTAPGSRPPMQRHWSWLFWIDNDRVRRTREIAAIRIVTI